MADDAATRVDRERTIMFAALGELCSQFRAGGIDEATICARMMQAALILGQRIGIGPDEFCTHIHAFFAKLVPVDTAGLN